MIIPVLCTVRVLSVLFLRPKRDDTLQNNETGVRASCSQLFLGEALAFLTPSMAHPILVELPGFAR